MIEAIESVKLQEVDHLLAVVAAIVGRLLEGDRDRPSEREEDA